MTADHRFDAAMTRALELALLGPAHGVNPQVGAVILDADLNIISEGWHLGSGTPHAEVAALAQLNLAQLPGSQLPAGATAVVTLEPCNHFGKTGPCAQALIAAGVSRVVYASSDPGDQSSGGAATLRAAGVEVIGGVMKAEADRQNRVWLTAATQGRPFVTLKWATSLDGRAAAADGTSQWISGPESRADSHRRRAEMDAILVGTGTVLADDPTLTARKPDGSLYEHQPLRVVLGERAIPKTAKVFNSDAATVVLATRDLNQALLQLKDLGVKHVWVEGGPQVASRFVAGGYVNEFVIYQAPMLLGGDRTALTDIGVAGMPQAKHLQINSVEQLGQDLLIVASPQNGTN
ncbi:MAG: bifunctional diaminohydroxyphosphoribosylaminopyrimidine deaminase/5-amino-6-(5-phosphoribosylamino)uracil reductase RibD [Actinomycetales bacterium]|nr:bifunctional diaminohydroxyphosphoribosylaminopyrimidine deaminase/5-amino-6-(5-phosphoribosylamino)uracil reductase RibD [Actinomycetales bacterium]